MLLHPGEAPISGSRQVESIQVRYGELGLALFGWKLNWLVVFFVASILFGFALRKVLGVEI